MGRSCDAYMEKTVYISIGSNIGNSAESCLSAIGFIEDIPSCRVAIVSDFYETEPVGVKNQSWFINCVIEAKTELKPLELLDKCLAIEATMGRIRQAKWSPRIIDIDLLLFGQEIIHIEKKLIIPHPRMHKRRFVLEPLSKIAPMIKHPVFDCVISDLLKNLPANQQEVKPLKKDS
jgi:2-amino-4-hydroxy-6-hydroxymethyldihydropteridine pyrophosphokinase